VKPPEPVKPSEPVKPPVPVKQPEPVNDSAANLVVEPRVTNVTFADEKLIVQLNAPVKWTSYLLDKPDRLVIDLPGMILDEKVSKSQSSKLKAIAQVRSAQNSVSPALVKVVVDFNTKVPYKITEQSALKQIVIDFTTATIPVVNPELPIVPIDSGLTQQLLKSKKIVVIDAGHGGLDPGAVSMYRQNANEKDFNLNVALRVQRLLSTDTKLQVVMTRTNDTFLTLNDRVVVANNLKADAFVSIHANAFKNLTTIRGTETFYSRPDSIGLAQIMHKHLLETTGFPDRRVKQADYRVIMSTTMPAVLLEAGFISNPIEEKFIFDSDFQNRVAEAIVKALREYFAEKA
jgi:N-acetylmuramoyl-L-alanine amidase